MVRVTRRSARHQRLHEVLHRRLRRAGYEMVEAEDGVKALEAMNGQHLDCVITDIDMPNMDAIELIRRLRAVPVHRGTPILMLTTATEAEEKQEGHAAGATGWLARPFHPDELKQAVSDLVPA